MLVEFTVMLEYLALVKSVNTLNQVLSVEVDGLQSTKVYVS